MSTTSKIEWTEATWNPTVGCTHVSEECDHCYAAVLASGRLSATPAYAGLAEGGKFNGTIRLLPDRLEQVLRWRKPRMIFVNSMSDLFHDKIEAGFIAHVFAVMQLAGQHRFQVLTKRHARMRALLTSRDFLALVDDHRERIRPGCGDFRWPLPNVWLGVSAGNQKWTDIRIPHLLATPAAVRFVSAEPLLGPVDLKPGLWLPPVGGGPRLDPTKPWEPPGRALDWVIVGGESGRDDGIRPMHPDWARSLRDQCAATGTAFFFKQWGEWGPAPWSVRIPEPADGWDAADPHWIAAAKAEAEARGATHCVRPDGSLYEPEHKTWSLERDPDGHYPGAVRRWGKKAAGRELDGRTWDEYPGGDAV